MSSEEAIYRFPLGLKWFLDALSDEEAGRVIKAAFNGEPGCGSWAADAALRALRLYWQGVDE